MPKSLYDLMPGIHLLYMTVEYTEFLPLFFKVSLGTGYDCPCPDKTKGYRYNANNRHKRAYRQHHNDNAGKGEHGCNQLGKTLLQCAADIIDIVGDPAQDLSVGV
jgi:hypothetical protein